MGQIFLSTNRGIGSTFRVHFSGHILFPVQIQYGSKIWVRQFSLLQEKTTLPSPGFRDCTIHFVNCKSFLPAEISPPDGISRYRPTVTNKTNRTNKELRYSSKSSTSQPSTLAIALKWLCCALLMLLFLCSKSWIDRMDTPLAFASWDWDKPLIFR